MIVMRAFIIFYEEFFESIYLMKSVVNKFAKAYFYRHHTERKKYNYEIKKFKYKKEEKIILII